LKVREGRTSPPIGGGTGFNFTITPDKPRKFWFEQYSNSADRFRDAVTKAGADVLIANHPSQDGAKTKTGRARPTQARRSSSFCDWQRQRPAIRDDGRRMREGGVAAASINSSPFFARV
jgi:hypothetical protein